MKAKQITQIAAHSSIPHPPTKFLRLPQVLELFPVSKSTWWNGVKTGKYPKAVKLGQRTTAWSAESKVLLIQPCAVTLPR